MSNLQYNTWDVIKPKILKDTGQEKNKKFSEWLDTKQHLNFYFTSHLWFRAFKIAHAVNNEDRDHFIVNSGLEGSGKTTLSLQLAAVIDPTFCLDRICYRPEQFIEGIEHSKKGQAFVLDEGNLFLFSREAMGSNNKIMVKLFALMRQKNLCVIVNVPNFYTVDSYIRDHRVRTLLEIPKRGYFKCIIGSGITQVSKDGNKYKRVGGVHLKDGTYFYGTFRKGIPEMNDITWETYSRYKQEEFDKFIQDIKGTVEDYSANSKYIGTKEASRILNTRQQLIADWCKAGRLKGVRIGGHWRIKREIVEKCLEKGLES